jgi:TRAP-type mannitol/chloroaromatic compound transport system substrate-binding protein
MTRRIVRALRPALTLGVALALAGPAAAPPAALAQAKPVRWKMASAFAAVLPVLGPGGLYMTGRLETITAGRIQIKFFDPGKLVPALQIFEAVSTGAVDAGWSAAGFWSGKIPSAVLFTAVPFGPDTGEYLAWIYDGGGLKLWREIYAKHNVHPLPCGMLPPEASGWFRQEIKSLDQFKGMKIRFFGIGGKVMQKLGASVQLLAPGDIFPALERGVLDATEFSMPALDEKQGLYQVAKHYYFPAWHQQASILELIVNKARWDALAEADQILIDAVCRDTILKTITEGETIQNAAIERMKAKGVKVHTWPPSIIAAFRKTTDEVLREEAKADADFARVWKSLQAFREDYAVWAKLSRLKS